MINNPAPTTSSPTRLSVVPYSFSPTKATMPSTTAPRPTSTLDPETALTASRGLKPVSPAMLEAVNTEVPPAEMLPRIIEPPNTMMAADTRIPGTRPRMAKTPSTTPQVPPRNSAEIDASSAYFSSPCAVAAKRPATAAPSKTNAAPATIVAAEASIVHWLLAKPMMANTTTPTPQIASTMLPPVAKELVCSPR